MDYNKLEHKRAKQDGARIVNNSGRGPIAKGDAKTDDLLIDYKFTEGTSQSLNLKKFEKNEKDARAIDKQGVWVVEFLAHRNRRLAVVDWGYLQELEEAYEELKFRMEGLEK